MANYQVVNQNKVDCVLDLDEGSPIRIPQGQALWVDSRTLARLPSNTDLKSKGVRIEDEKGNQLSVEEVRSNEGLTRAALFLVQIDHLIAQFTAAKIKKSDEVLSCLRTWRQQGELGNVDVSKNGDKVIDHLKDMVKETIDSGSMGRRMANPIMGVAIYVYFLPFILVAAGSYLRKDITLLGVPLEFIGAVALFGTIGSLFRVLFRAVTHSYTETDRTALSLIGVARPIMGGILALFVAALFASGIVALPLQEPAKVVTFMGGGIEAGKLALLALAFLAGVSDELVMNLFARAGGTVTAPKK